MKMVTLVMIMLTYVNADTKKYEENLYMDQIDFYGETRGDARVLCKEMGNLWIESRKAVKGTTFSYSCMENYDAIRFQRFVELEQAEKKVTK